MLQQDPKLRRRTRQEHRIVAAALGVGVVHAIDDAVLNRQPGVPLPQHLPALAVVAVAAAVGAWVFPRLSPGLRSSLALVAGVLVGANGSMHVLQVASSSPQGSDVTGVVAALPDGGRGAASRWWRARSSPSSWSCRW
jgi:hypothetical protein